MILYKRRSAKSVACSRLNVMGVSAFFFFPDFVAAFTRADEFHSVMNTRWPSALSHFARRPSCVVLPDPSMPSTTSSFPGYSCGLVRLFNMCSSADGIRADFHVQRLAEHTLERGGMPCCGPELQLRIARCPKLQQSVV